MKDYCGICGDPVSGGLTNHPECEEQAFQDALADCDPESEKRYEHLAAVEKVFRDALARDAANDAKAQDEMRKFHIWFAPGPGNLDKVIS